MSTSTLLTNITNILSYITPSFSLIPTLRDVPNKSIDAPALQQHREPSRTIPQNCLLERRSSTLNLKSAAANPLLSLEAAVEVMSAATTTTLAYIPATTSISPSAGIDGITKAHAHAREAGQGRHADTQSKCEHNERHERGYAEPNYTVLDAAEGYRRDGERELMDVSASFNISLISDTSTSISTPSSSTDDLSLPPPHQLLLPSICAFPSPSPFQHPASQPLQDLLCRPFFMQEPEVYPYAYSTGGGLGLGISVPSEKWDSGGGGDAMVPLGGLGIVALGGWRGKMGLSVGPALYSLEEVEEEED